jgi:hypothetical protein
VPLVFFNFSLFFSPASPIIQQRSPNPIPCWRVQPAREACRRFEREEQALGMGAQLSESLDFRKEDAADDLVLNEIIWRSVRGPTSPMPAPVRAAFVFPHLRGE